MKNLLILGSTGLTGHQLMQLAQMHPQIGRIIAPTRRALPAHAKLENPLVDFENLPVHAPWWQADAVCCALGSTIKQAGSEAGFYRIDHDYVLMAARLAHAAGTPCFVLNSSLGAKVGAGSFYLRVKGEIERDLGSVGFASLTLVRPSLLDGGKRPAHRPGESFAIAASKLLGPLVPKKLRPISTRKVAQAMLQAALQMPAGVQVIESDALHGDAQD